MELVVLPAPLLVSRRMTIARVLGAGIDALNFCGAVKPL
jgi:hypothetical protein